MDWEERDDVVWLVVDDAERAGLGVEEVVHELDAAGHRELDLDAIARVLDTGEPGAVAALDPRRRSGCVEVVVADDGHTAVLAVHPPGDLAPPLSVDHVTAALTSAGVKLGVDHLLLDTLPLDVAAEYLVATGWPPVPGQDGRVEYLLELAREFRPEPRPDGGVDFHAVATIPDVEEDQLLAVLVDPTPGIPGRTVRGELVPAEPGTPVELPTGHNVWVSEDGRHLHAATNGLLEVDGGQLSVRPEYTVDGDVDYGTGSVCFSGDVVVRGSVRPGFSVHAGGRVVVMGDVEEAEVRGGALVWVRGAVVGERSLVHASGDVKVRTVRHGRIEAHGNLYIEREAHEATLLAGVDLVLERHRNRLSGGSTWAGNQVVAGEIGAVSGVATHVEVGTDPFTAELLGVLSGEAAEHRASLQRVEAAVAPFRDHADAFDRLPADRQLAVAKLRSVAASLHAQIAELEQRIAALEPPDDDRRPRIAARTALRPGAVVGIRGAQHVVRTTHHRVTVTAVDGVVTFSPLGTEPPARGERPALPAS